MRAKCIVIGEALRIKVKKFQQNLRENYWKSTKIAITACKFSKYFRVSMPPDHPKVFLASPSVSNKFSRKKYAWKKCGNYSGPLFKFLATPLVPVLFSCFLLNFSSVVRLISPCLSSIFILFTNALSSSLSSNSQCGFGAQNVFSNLARTLFDVQVDKLFPHFFACKIWSTH